MTKRKQLFDEEELRKIKLHPSFQNLFSIDDDLVAEIAENIKINGYDKSQPIRIWNNPETEENF